MITTVSLIVFGLFFTQSCAQLSQNRDYRSCDINSKCVPRHLCKNSPTVGADVCNDSEVCCSISKRTEHFVSDVAEKTNGGCGWRSNSQISKDFGSTTSEFGEFPWMVIVSRASKKYGKLNKLYVCGGSVIAPNVVLTASHCVFNRKASRLVVRAGEWDVLNFNESLSHDDKKVIEVIIHENYDKHTLYNDVALLILKKPFVWQDNIGPICLPESNTNFDYSQCYATGWGKDKFGCEGRYQLIMKKISLPVVPRGICQKNLRQTDLGLNFRLHKSFLCAGGERDKDTCQGDGGSPLVCPIPGLKDRYYQAGIVAWGVGCGGENVPGVYANLSYLRPWISEKLAARGIPFFHFTP